MNAVYFNTQGGPEALVYAAATMPGAGDGEIVVRVRAAAVTPTELLWVPTWTTRAGKPVLVMHSEDDQIVPYQALVRCQQSCLRTAH
jgi:NADPH:quinone reductase-like Zn-dependent oxidoreductase